MKTYGNLFEKMISFENLVQAAARAQSGKRLRVSTAGFNFFMVRKLREAFSEGRAGVKQVSDSVRAWIAHASHGNTYKLRKKLLGRVVFCGKRKDESGTNGVFSGISALVDNEGKQYSSNESAYVRPFGGVKCNIRPGQKSQWQVWQLKLQSCFASFWFNDERNKKGYESYDGEKNTQPCRHVTEEFTGKSHSENRLRDISKIAGHKFEPRIVKNIFHAIYISYLQVSSNVFGRAQ